MLLPDVGGTIDAAVQTGQTAALADMFTDIRSAVDIALASSGDVHVELESVAGFYNALSAVYQDLDHQAATLRGAAASALARAAGGQVAGVKSAWDAMAAAAGAGAGDTSLFANIRVVQAQLAKFLLGLAQTAQSYAQQENVNLVILQRAAGGADGAAAPAATPPGPAPAGDRSVTGASTSGSQQQSY